MCAYISLPPALSHVPPPSQAGLQGLHTSPSHIHTYTHPSPLTKGMQARQNLGASVAIQADAAHQELLVHRLDLWARAVLPLRHGAHRRFPPLTAACVQRDGQLQGGPHFLSPPEPHHSNPLQRTNSISSLPEVGWAVTRKQQGEVGGLRGL